MFVKLFSHLPYFESYTCPHCVGIKGGCCRCGGTRKLGTELLVMRAAGHVWRYHGCACDACVHVGRGPARRDG